MPDESEGPVSRPPFLPICEDGGMLRNYPRPRDIESLLKCFGKHEVELSAGRLLEFFRTSDRWCSFTIEELTAFYKSHDGWNSNDMFYGLQGPYFDDGGMMGYREPDHIYVVGVGGGKYNVTNHFIEQCAQNLKQAA